MEKLPLEESFFFKFYVLREVYDRLYVGAGSSYTYECQGPFYFWPSVIFICKMRIFMPFNFVDWYDIICLQWYVIIT